MEIPFTKLHGNGNDFILVDEYLGYIIPDEMKGEFARLYCDRRFGIGADGVLYLSLAPSKNLKMRLFQPDESEAEMCGNGLRCFAKYAYDNRYTREKCTVETPVGLIEVQMGYVDDHFSATIRMPDPEFDRPKIPAKGKGDYVEEIADYTVYAVNVGVPHAVVFVHELAEVPVAQIAPIIRHHPTFSKGANVNFVEVDSENNLHIRTYERGVEDETMSCGTGATASAAVAHRLGYPGVDGKAYMGKEVHVLTKGGSVTVRLGDETTLEGPAVTVFSGIISF
ncbi:MAG: diaminopimelate epimerase [Methanomicrobiaceae archaeon]|nr:diaminopimelate epimerase [Methanomicrobiaceae archaeon]